MNTDKAVKCTGWLSPCGLRDEYVTITVQHQLASGEAVATTQHGQYPALFEQVTKDVAYWTINFLNDAGKANGSIQPDDARQAYVTAHNHVMRRLGY